MTTGIFAPIYKIFHLPQVDNTEQRMVSNFGYANAFAIMLSVTIFLTIQQVITNTAQRKKSIDFYFYVISCFICFIGILLSYSKAVMLILLITFVIFLFALKNKRMQVLELIAPSFILALLYSRFFEEMIVKENQYSVFILLRRNGNCFMFHDICNEKINTIYY